MNKLGQAGIDGMLKSLNDPWTEYLSPSLVRSFEQDLQGTYSGIGATMQMKGDRLLVTSVFDGSPARRRAWRPATRSSAWTAEPTAGLSLVANIGHIKGAAGTKVTLVVAPAAGGAAAHPHADPQGDRRAAHACTACCMPAPSRSATWR